MEKQLVLVCAMNGHAFVGLTNVTYETPRADRPVSARLITLNPVRQVSSINPLLPLGATTNDEVGYGDLTVINPVYIEDLTGTFEKPERYRKPQAGAAAS